MLIRQLKTTWNVLKPSVLLPPCNANRWARSANRKLLPIIRRIIKLRAVDAALKLLQVVED